MRALVYKQQEHRHHRHDRATHHGWIYTIFQKRQGQPCRNSQIARIKGIYEANEIGDTMGADPAWWEVDIATGNYILFNYSLYLSFS